jgi:hypothetical protein
METRTRGNPPLQPGSTSRATPTSNSVYGAFGALGSAATGLAWQITGTQFHRVEAACGASAVVEIEIASARLGNGRHPETECRLMKQKELRDNFL